mmetsp:Transcript_54153/g.126000  ORF Transcript_54153/g.126000 Transcript_54153/m.126000 type:complete len:334 (-) Transcript_54153:222-1223(-)
MAAANAASLRLWPWRACCRSVPRARAKGAWREVASFCRKPTPGVMALAKTSLLASSVRMASACAMPSSSSARSDDRADHSSVLAMHDTLASSKNTMSASNCTSESAKPCMASASIVSASVLTCSFLATLSFITCSCSRQVAMSNSCCRPAAPSSAVRDSRLLAKVSYMSCRIPCTVRDCGAYLPPAAAAVSNAVLNAASCVAWGCALAGSRPAVMRTCASAGATDAECSSEVACVESRRMMIAFSRAASASSSSTFSAMNAALSFCRMVVRVCCLLSFSWMSSISCLISASVVATVPFSRRISEPSRCNSALSAVMEAAFLAVMASHQQANLS